MSDSNTKTENPSIPITRRSLRGADRQTLYALFDKLVGESNRRRKAHGAHQILGTKMYLSPETYGGSHCWIWKGKSLSAVYWRGDTRTNTKITSLAYDTAYPELFEPERLNSRKLTSTCGTPKCFNPSHLTDLHWGYWEDFTFMVNHGEKPSRIVERLGGVDPVARADGLLKDPSHPFRKAYNRYLVLVADDLEQDANTITTPARQQMQARAGLIRANLAARAA